jgi:DinB superfamily
VENVEVDDLVERLAATPGRIAAASAGRSPEQLSAPPSDDEWSALAVLAHLRASDDILSPRLVAMLVRDEPALPAFDDRRWCEVMAYTDADFQTLLATLTFRRAELVSVLRRLSPDHWRRAGLHEKRGRITLLDTLRHIVAHEEEHCFQLEAALSRPI